MPSPQNEDATEEERKQISALAAKYCFRSILHRSNRTKTQEIRVICKKAGIEKHVMVLSKWRLLSAKEREEKIASLRKAVDEAVDAL